MSPTGQSSGELIDFVEVLRLNGYRVSTEQYIAAQRLLVTLAAQGDYLRKPESLESLMAPVLCTSPEEQAVFPTLYAQWLATRPRIFAVQGEAAGSATPPQSQPLPKPKPTPSDVPTSRIKWWYWLLALLLAAGIVWLFLTVRESSAKAYSLRVTIEGATPPSGDEDTAPPSASGKVRVQVISMGGTGNLLKFPAPLILADTEPMSEDTFIVNYTGNDLPLVINVNYESGRQYTETFAEPVYTFIVGRERNKIAYSMPANTRLGQRLWRYLQVNSALLVGSAAGVMVALLLLRLLLRRGRRMGLKKWRSENKPQLDRLSVKGSSEFLARAFPLRRTAQELRRYREYDAYDIDVHRTIEETIRYGLFTPAYSPRKSLPEYLVLIDRADFDDHQARFADEVVAQLEMNDVYVERFYFQGDPRSCRKDDPKAPFQTIPELAAEYPNHNLLIFGDAEGFFSPVTGRPRNWIEMFSQWETRVLLTSELPAEDYREWVLNTVGFKVLPANRAGLTALGETLHDGLKRDHQATGAGASLPPDLYGRQARWLESQPPSSKSLEELCRQLKEVLGAEGYVWLSACAVYPVLNWDLTLYLGHELFSKGDFAATLSTLVRLPWFRHGSMPDWLRERLIFEMSPEQELRVRNALQALLLSSLKNPGGFDLFLARESVQAQRPGLFRRAWNRALGLGQDERKFVVGNLESEPEDSPLRDYVLLSFMAGSKPNRLTLNVPDEVLNKLRAPNDSGREVLFFRLLTALALLSCLPFFLVLYISNESTAMSIGMPSMFAWALLVSYSMEQLLPTPASGKRPLATVFAFLSDRLELDGLNARLTADLEAIERFWPLIKKLLPQPPATPEQVALGQTITAEASVAAKSAVEVAIVNAPVTISALHQLPPPPRDFTGHARELEELMSKIESGGVTISGLQGLGGIGKTALALKLAELLTPRYPDAQFYLDLKGLDKQPLSIAEALSHVIRAYHPAAKLPEDEAELRALYLSLLHDKRALLLLDNAAGREQVEPLIPPESCILLVTSRRRFYVPGLFALSLETLPPEDARELLLKIAPHIGDYADEIAKLCGYLPLALRLAASALAQHLSLSPADYVRNFSGSKKRFELVEASLTLSYELLRPGQQRLWRALAVFPDTFDARAAAAVWELGVDAAQGMLGDLIRYSLLEWDADTSRYSLHDLARLFADSRMRDDERYATYMQHAAHYLTVLEECGDLYLKGGDTIKSGLALFDVERRNIEAGQEWVYRHSSGDEAVAWLCNEYPNAGAYVLSLRQHPRERVSWLEAALAAARQLKDRASEGRHLGNLGIAYAQLGEYRRAIGYYENSVAIAREIGDHMGEGRSLQSLGTACARLGELERAVEFSEQAIAIMREIGNRDGQASVLGNLGQIYFALGRTVESINFYEQQLYITREVGNRLGEAATLFNMSLALYDTGRRAKAIQNAEAALEIFERVESPNAEKVREVLTRWEGS